MGARARRIRLFPFFAGAAVGSLLGLLVGALFGGSLGQSIEALTAEALDRLFGRRDEELRLDLLLQ